MSEDDRKLVEAVGYITNLEDARLTEYNRIVLRQSAARITELSEQVEAKDAGLRGPLSEAEDDEAVAYYWYGQCHEARAALAKSQAEVERLREVLEPFAELAENFVGDDEDDDDLYRPPLYEHQKHVTIRSLRGARTALENHDGQK